jgi:hypothetical protein
MFATLTALEKRRRAGAMEDAVEKADIKRMYEWIQGQVRLVPGSDDPVVAFDAPTAEDFHLQGFDGDMVALTLGAKWWPEMILDIIDTPEFAEPDETPEQVLKYARDVVVEYFRKRFGT